MDFQAFDTLDEMMQAITKAREAADRRVKSWQAAVKPGDYFAQDTDYGFMIFGHVLATEDDFYKADEGMHYRCCNCFSVACPDGEVGDVHVSVISALISKTMFEAIKANNWQLDNLG